MIPLDKTHFASSYGLLAHIQNLPTSIIQELTDELTVNNLPAFLDLLTFELSRREEENLCPFCEKVTDDDGRCKCTNSDSD